VLSSTDQSTTRSTGRSGSGRVSRGAEGRDRFEARRLRRQRMARGRAVRAVPPRPQHGRPRLVGLLRGVPAARPGVRGNRRRRADRTSVRRRADGPRARPRGAGPRRRSAPVRRRRRRPGEAAADRSRPRRPRPARHRAVRSGRGPRPRAHRAGPGRRRGAEAARPRGPRGDQHGVLAGGPHRHQRACRPGHADGGQPHRRQQPPRSRPRRQGVVHAPHRLRDGRGADADAGDELVVHAAGRQAGGADAGPRQPRHRHRPVQAGRDAAAAGAVGEEGGHARLRPVLGRLRGRGPPGPAEQARGGRLRRDHGVADQPRHDRDGALRAAPDAGPGHHRRRRCDGLPGGVRRHVRRAAEPDGHLQGAHADLDVRPPDHPGRPVRRLPADHRGEADRSGRLLRPDLHVAAARADT